MIKYRNVNIPVFSIPPDWKDKFGFGEKFGDVSLEAISTMEERLGTQPRPLHTVKFKTLTLSEQETGFIRKAIEAAGDMPVAVPLWNSKLVLTKDAVIGNSFVACDPTADGLFDLAPFCIVWHDFDVFETFRTFSIGPNGIQFDAPLTVQFRAGDVVIPLIVGHFKREPEAAETDTLGEFPVSFEETFLTTGPAFFENQPGSAGQYGQSPIGYELYGGERLDQFSKIAIP